MTLQKDRFQRERAKILMLVLYNTHRTHNKLLVGSQYGH